MARKTDLQNQQMRREQILAAAAQVFSTVGYSRATTKQIAATAGVSEGLVYTYFKSKDELLVAMLNHLTRRSPALSAGEKLPELIHAEVARTLTQPRVENAIFAAVIAEVLVNPDLRRSYREQRYDLSLEQLREFLQQRIAAGDIPDQEPEITARICLALLLGLGILRLLGDPLLQPDHPRMDALVETTSRAILNVLTK